MTQRRKKQDCDADLDSDVWSVFKHECQKIRVTQILVFLERCWSNPSLVPFFKPYFYEIQMKQKRSGPADPEFRLTTKPTSQRRHWFSDSKQEMNKETKCPYKMSQVWLSESPGKPTSSWWAEEPVWSPSPRHSKILIQQKETGGIWVILFCRWVVEVCVLIFTTCSM